MVGGNFDGHPWGHQGTYCICNEDPKHPIVSGIFGSKQSFNLNDELYQYKDFDRKKVRVWGSRFMACVPAHMWADA